jgi:hypothetical protein
MGLTAFVLICCCLPAFLARSLGKQLKEYEQEKASSQGGAAAAGGPQAPLSGTNGSGTGIGGTSDTPPAPAVTPQAA